MKRRVALAALACMLADGRAWGAPTAQQKGQAEALFREGRAAMNAGRYPEACAKFEESQRLDPHLGTQLNMALCHANIGKTASAWAEFGEVAELADRERDPERANYARQQAAHLEKKLARVVFRVTSPAEGTEVRLDGQSIGPSAWTTPLPVDPGEHVVEASAPGKKPFKKTASAPAATTTEIAIPALEDAPQAAPPPPPPQPEKIVPPPKEPPVRKSPVPAYVLGGVGVVGLGIGTVFGLQTFSKKSDADAKCPGDVCTQEGHDLEGEARTSAIISTIGFGVGIVALGAGAWWLLTSKPTTASLRVAPTLGGVAVDGHF
jgi:hypothetical protein